MGAGVDSVDIAFGKYGNGDILSIALKRCKNQQRKIDTEKEGTTKVVITKNHFRGAVEGQ